MTALPCIARRIDRGEKHCKRYDRRHGSCAVSAWVLSKTKRPGLATGPGVKCSTTLRRSAAAACRAAGVALLAGAVADHREVLAFRARVAGVALHQRLLAAFGCERLGVSGLFCGSFREERIGGLLIFLGDVLQELFRTL